MFTTKKNNCKDNKLYSVLYSYTSLFYVHIILCRFWWSTEVCDHWPSVPCPKGGGYRLAEQPGYRKKRSGWHAVTERPPGVRGGGSVRRRSRTTLFHTPRLENLLPAAPASGGLPGDGGRPTSGPEQPYFSKSLSSWRFVILGRGWWVVGWPDASPAADRLPGGRGRPTSRPEQPYFSKSLSSWGSVILGGGRRVAGWPHAAPAADRLPGGGRRTPSGPEQPSKHG